MQRNNFFLILPNALIIFNTSFACTRICYVKIFIMIGNDIEVYLENFRAVSE